MLIAEGQELFSQKAELKGRNISIDKWMVFQIIKGLYRSNVVDRNFLRSWQNYNINGSVLKFYDEFRLAAAVENLFPRLG